MGRKKITFPSKTDCHPKRGWINWWENVITPTKARERRRVEMEIEEQLGEAEIEDGRNDGYK
ncbi:MAG: hypothetical protein KAR20_02005 [Candidatus Heimdallarchaeota archaeon]|nr:hypothetical protein [Candidatus Heimdallarchaeota archaeon]